MSNDICILLVDPQKRTKPHSSTPSIATIARLRQRSIAAAGAAAGSAATAADVASLPLPESPPLADRVFPEWRKIQVRLEVQRQQLRDVYTSQR